MKCKLCNIREATIRDRNTMSRRKVICSECHAERLKGDLRYILDRHNKSFNTDRKPAG
jgi:hypothetical protein